MTENLTLTNNAAATRYELHHGHELIGLIDYRIDGDVMDMHHTEVDPDHGGNGHGNRIVEFALNDAREAGFKVRPTCPFVAKYIHRHEDFWDLRA